LFVVVDDEDLSILNENDILIVLVLSFCAFVVCSTSSAAPFDWKSWATGVLGEPGDSRLNSPALVVTDTDLNNNLPPSRRNHLPMVLFVKLPK
jgi:hypothetical protein